MGDYHYSSLIPAFKNHENVMVLSPLVEDSNFIGFIVYDTGKTVCQSTQNGTGGLTSQNKAIELVELGSGPKPYIRWFRFC